MARPERSAEALPDEALSGFFPQAGRMTNAGLPEEYRSTLRVGTCSWKFDSWKGLIYGPDKDCGPDDYLHDWARRRLLT